MDTGGLIWIHFFLISVCVCAVSEGPLATSVINCNEAGNEEFGPVDEGFSGDVELVTGITAGSNVKLVPYIFPDHVEFLELNFTAGETTATVRTKKPLDAEMLIDSNSTLYYSIMCDGEIKYNNTRTLKITDLNDNGPIFEQPSYSTTVSEAEPVNTIILQVKAKDADITPAYNEVTYSMEPTSEDFMMTNSGALILKRPLNYTLVQSYSFTVKAQVLAVDQVTDGLTATAQVSITILDVNDKAPQFPDIPDPLHISEEVYSEVRVQVEDVNEAPQFPPEVYKASVFSTDPYKTPVIQIKASEPDVGDEGQLEYSLVSGSPYFDVDASSGLVFVVSVANLSGQAATVEVKISNPKGLNATAKVEVDVQCVSRSDVVTISLNQPANVVERNIPEMEKSLGKALDWTVDIIEVSNSTRGSPKSRTLREAAKSLVNFIAVDKAEVVSYEEVVKKLQSESAAVTDELTKVFGEDVQLGVVQRAKKFNWQSVTIPVSVIVPVIIVVLTISFKRFKRKNEKVTDEETVDMDKLTNKQRKCRNLFECYINFRKDQRPGNEDGRHETGQTKQQ